MATLMLAAFLIRRTRIGQQALAVTRVGMATIPQRLGSCSVVVLGVGGVVGVLVALLSMSTGFEATLEKTGADDTAIVLRAGAQAEIYSVIDHSSVVAIETARQVLRNDRGQPIADPELVVIASIPRKSSGLDANIEIRGVGEHAWELHPDIKLISGRKPVRGMPELIVGKGAREQFTGLDIGSTVRLNGQSWTVVGAFDSDDAHTSEAWGDAAVVASAYRRGSGITSITVRLADAAAFDSFKSSLTSDPRLKVEVRTTRDYYTEQAQGLAHMMRRLGTSVALIMAMGATLAMANTLTAAVAARPQEIATLRSLGFSLAPIVVSVLLETMLLALLGGVLGTAIAWAIFDNWTVSTLGENYSQVVFAFKVSPELFGSGLKWALATGFIGGLLPALRAASMPVAAGNGFYRA